MRQYGTVRYRYNRGILVRQGVSGVVFSASLIRSDAQGRLMPLWCGLVDSLVESLVESLVVLVEE